MTTRTSNRSGFAVLAEATSMDISLIGTKRDGQSLQLERPPKRLRNDDEERCDAIDTIGSAIISHAGLADDAVFRTVTVTGREPAITKVTKVLSDALQQFTEPANTQGLTHEEETNCKRVLREVILAVRKLPALAVHRCADSVPQFTRVCCGKYLSHNYWQSVAQPSPTDLMRHLLSAPHRHQFVAFAGGDEQKLCDMISLYDHPTLFSTFSNDVHTATVGEAIQAVDAWIRNHQPGARTLRRMLEFELNVQVLWDVLATDLDKDLHEHVQAINERRHNSIDIKNIARAFNESCKQQWIKDAEEAKLLVTYDKYEATVADLTAAIQTPTDRNTAIAGELATVRSDFTARIAELETVNSNLTTSNTALATELDTVRSELATTKDTVKTLTETVTALTEKVTELLAREKSAV
ncbi:hypothetical protein FN846DRAFT_894506 [Sphaerosporella brunnea]|uniref:Uncharacterized protein n=1 Tax=Sphaerosporella brunnea TaxID=1250544 RepID=A0A5J5EK12_9PEZI|nr:hypothetical protein FN846DRAFT_894506 [Sphaerosporella brunnea]